MIMQHIGKQRVFTSTPYQTKVTTSFHKKTHFLQFHRATRTFALIAIFPKYNFVANILKLIHVLNYFRNDFLALQFNPTQPMLRQQQAFLEYELEIRPKSSDACICGTQVYQLYSWSTVPHNIPKQLAHWGMRYCSSFKPLLQIVTRVSDQHVWLVATNLNFLKDNDFYCTLVLLQIHIGDQCSFPRVREGPQLHWQHLWTVALQQNPNPDQSSKLKIPATKVCKLNLEMVFIYF